MKRSAPPIEKHDQDVQQEAKRPLHHSGKQRLPSGIERRVAAGEFEEVRSSRGLPLRHHLPHRPSGHILGREQTFSDINVTPANNVNQLKIRERWKKELR